jgi:hypothetical protein
VLGDLWASMLSLETSEKALGVGLEGRAERLVLELRAELRAEGYVRFWFWRMLNDESSRLVTGRRGYGWLMSARGSGALLSSLLLL